MGKNKDKRCLECNGVPLIKGNSWGSHCNNYHKGRKVKFEFVTSVGFGDPTITLHLISENASSMFAGPATVPQN
jgi:hypothetical protein